MQPNSLESTEYYHRRYNPVCQIIVFPIFFLVVAAVLLGSFLKMDATVTGTGVVMTPTQHQVVGLISEHDISALKQTQQVRFTIQGNPQLAKGLTGKIIKISDQPKIVRGQTYYGITVHLQENHLDTKLLKPGMHGQLAVVTGTKTYLQYLREQL